LVVNIRGLSVSRRRGDGVDETRFSKPEKVGNAIRERSYEKRGIGKETSKIKHPGAFIGRDPGHMSTPTFAGKEIEDVR